MRVQGIRFIAVEEFEQFFAGCTGTDIDLLQLTPGLLNFTSTQVDLQGILLEWNRVGTRIRSREVYRGSGVLFSFLLQGSDRVKVCGNELDYGNVVLWHSGEELEYIAPTGVTSLTIHVDAALADLFGWTLNGGTYRLVPIPCLMRLEQTCRLATRAVQRQGSVGIDAGVDTQSLQDAARWRDRILVEVESVLASWLTSPTSANKTSLPGTHHFRLIKDAERFFEQYDLGQSKTVDAIAEGVGVPRRTLFHAFRTYMGIGPYAYLQLIRLHRLRDRLLAESPAETSVTKLASELGFDHMGRLSAAYRKHFGEYPRETLKRE